MYGWLNRHLGLGADEPVLERDFVPLTRAEATVWTPAHPAPSGGEAHERAVTAWLTEDTARQLQLMRPRDAATLGAWREVLGGAVAALLARPVPAASDVLVLRGQGRRLADPNGATTTLRVQPFAEQVQVDVLEPQRPGSDVVVWTSAQGRAACGQRGGTADRGCAVTARRGPPRGDCRRVRAGRRREGQSPGGQSCRGRLHLRIQRAAGRPARARHAGCASPCADAGRARGPRDACRLGRPVGGVGGTGPRPCRDAGRCRGVCHQRFSLWIGHQSRGRRVSAGRLPSTATCRPCSHSRHRKPCGLPARHPTRSPC